MPRTPKLRNIKIKNLKEEREKFFSRKNYNPQFKYDEMIDDKVLKDYGTPDKDLFEYSKYLINKAIIDYGPVAEVFKHEGPLLTLSQTKEDYDEYLDENNLKRSVIVEYHDNLIARTNTALTDDKRIVLRVRVPIAYRQRSLDAVLDHEIGTHAFRWINEMQQPWYDSELRESFADHLKTEEGLATLHWLMTHPIKIPLQQAIYYYVVFLSQYLSFGELFDAINKLVDDRETAWQLTVRAKRGMTDTSKPGGYTKDIVYLEGIRDVSKWLAENEYRADKLYQGKISIVDVNKCLKLSEKEIRLPLFVSNEEYSDKIASVIEENEFLTL